MWRLAAKDGHHKDTRVMMTLDYWHRLVKFIQSFIMNMSMRSTWSFTKIKNLHFGLSQLLQIDFGFETWNGNLCDLQLLTKGRQFSNQSNCQNMSMELAHDITQQVKLVMWGPAYPIVCARILLSLFLTSIVLNPSLIEMMQWGGVSTTLLGRWSKCKALVLSTTFIYIDSCTRSPRIERTTYPFYVIML